MKKALPFVLLLALTACQKKDDPVVTPPVGTPPATTPVTPPAAGTTGTVRFRYTPMVGSEPLVLNDRTYTNAAGETFTVSTHKYFVSNFSLTDSAGAELVLPPAYFLVSADSLRTVSIAGVRSGRYTKLSFLIGVDSARNVSGVQEGDLDPGGRARGMFWDWNTGYIMAKMEGTSPQSADKNQHSLTYHIGTFSGPYSALRRVTLDLPAPLVVTDSTAPTVQLQSDLAAWFGGPLPLYFAQTNMVMSGNQLSKFIANNYANAYKVVRIDP